MSEDTGPGWLGGTPERPALVVNGSQELRSWLEARLQTATDPVAIAFGDAAACPD